MEKIERRLTVSAKKVESVIHADGVVISVVTTVGGEDDYISLTDIAKHRNPEFRLMS